MYTYNFEKLDIWKISMDLAVSVYKITDDFPRSEKFGLINQLRRASSSVSANIAEGMSRGGKDRARFIQIAFGSSIEVLNFLILSEKVGFINSEILETFRLQILALTNKLNAFHKQIDK